MDRQTAIELVARAQARAATRAQREAWLIDWWAAWDEATCASLPELLRKEMQTRHEPSADPMAEKYVPLLELAAKAELPGVTNAWLSQQVQRILGEAVEVEGECEPVSACPCCRFRTLPQRGAYDICPVCFWEDDGSVDPMRPSGANGMTLGEARAAFERIGAVEERLLPHVLPDGPERYSREA